MDMDGGDLIIGQIGSGIADEGGLRSCAAKVADGQIVARVDLVIHLDDAVVADVVAWIGSGVVIASGGTI